METASYKDSISLDIMPWGEDSVLPDFSRKSYYNIYPYNCKDNLTSVIENRSFETMVLENEYLCAVVVPALGARLFSLYDKVAGRHVFNMPNGVYPSPIYLRGVFFPIGIEFNIPCGHTVHAAECIPCRFEDNGASKSIVMCIFNAVARIAVEITISLSSNERILRTKTRIINTLPVRNGFMYWANSAVETTPNLKFQCKAPMSHFFDSYNTFPMINGTDSRIAQNRNFASDLFAIGSKEEWFGFYSPEKKHGCAHISPLAQMTGKKFFSWGFDDLAFKLGKLYGCSEYGYVEMQAGILETQYQFLHLEPFEEKIIDEAWFPYNSVDDISYADDHFIVASDSDSIRLTPSKPFHDIYISISSNGHLAERYVDMIVPGDCITLAAPSSFDPESYDLMVRVGKQTVIEKSVRPISVASPEDIKTKQAWLDLKPDNPHNILEIAFRHYKARRFDKAEELVQKLLETDLADKAYRLLAEIAYLMDDIESALEYARKAGGNIQNELNQGTMCLEDIIGGVSMLDYYGVMAEADAQYSSGCPKRAAELLNNYCSNTGKSTPSIQYIQRFLCKNDSNSKYDATQPSGAESGHTNPFTRLEKQALLQAVEKDSDNAQVFNLLGNYYSRIDSVTAHRFWSQSIRISPIDYLPLRASAYKLMRERQDLNEAVGLYESALSIKNDCPDLVCEYLTCLRLHGDLRRAMDFLDNMDVTVSSNYKIVKARISLLRDNHRFEEAVNTILASDHLHFWEGERYTHRCYLECLMELGNIAISCAEYDTAEKWFMMMLDHPKQLHLDRAFDQNESAAYYHLGLISELKHNYNRAEQYYKMAVNQPYPKLHHFPSYRENEYYAALAARKIIDGITYHSIIDRLIACDTPDFGELGLEFMPTNSMYWIHTAAARGYILAERHEEARKSLDRLIFASGHCWLAEHTERLITRSLSVRRARIE